MALSLPVPVRTTQVSIFSNQPTLAYLPVQQKSANKFYVTPNSLNSIPLMTKTFTPEKREVVVNAIGKYFSFV